MNAEDIREALERMGYKDGMLSSVERYVEEYHRRKSVFAEKALTLEDIVTASMMFDVFVKARKVM